MSSKLRCKRHPDNNRRWGGGGSLKINQQMIRELWEDFKRNHPRIFRVPEGQKGDCEEEATVRDITAEKFPELERACIQTQEAQKGISKRHPDKNIFQGLER